MQGRVTVRGAHGSGSPNKTQTWTRPACAGRAFADVLRVPVARADFTTRTRPAPSIGFSELITRGKKVEMRPAVCGGTRTFARENAYSRLGNKLCLE